MKTKIYRNIAIALVCIILGIMLAWQFKSVHYNQQVASLENKREEDLKDELIAEKQKNEGLQTKLTELEKQVSDYQNTEGGNTEVINNLKSDIEKARTIAGLTEVKGKGLIITIEDGDLFMISDTELLRLINELKASGAQAISFNGERMVSTSEIREAGNYIMVNGKQMVSPYVIKAIANQDELEHSLRIIGGEIENLEKMYKVTVVRSDNIDIPKVRDDGTVIRTDLLTPVK